MTQVGEKTVGGDHVAVGESSGEYEQIVIETWLIVAICGSKFIQCC